MLVNLNYLPDFVFVLSSLLKKTWKCIFPAIHTKSLFKKQLKPYYGFKFSFNLTWRFSLVPEPFYEYTYYVQVRQTNWNISLWPSLICEYDYINWKKAFTIAIRLNLQSVNWIITQYLTVMHLYKILLSSVDITLQSNNNLKEKSKFFFKRIYFQQPYFYHIKNVHIASLITNSSNIACFLHP